MGIHIFLTEFHRFLGDRASFLIPADIEQRLARGSAARYNAQYRKFHTVQCGIPSLQHLLNLIVSVSAITHLIWLRRPYFTSSNVIIYDYQLVMNTWYRYVVQISLNTILNVADLLLTLFYVMTTKWIVFISLLSPFSIH